MQHGGLRANWNRFFPPWVHLISVFAFCLTPPQACLCGGVHNATSLNTSELAHVFVWIKKLTSVCFSIILCVWFIGSYKWMFVHVLACVLACVHYSRNCLLHSFALHCIYYACVRACYVCALRASVSIMCIIFVLYIIKIVWCFCVVLYNISNIFRYNLDTYM